MSTSRGRAATKAFMRAVPSKLTDVVRGGARAGAAVISDEIKLRTPSDEVRDNLRTRTKTTDESIVVTIDLPPGWARSVGTWLEFGTSEHFISVDPDVSGGRLAPRVNELVEKGDADLKGTLVINGKPVGRTVHHPGTAAQPTFRTAMDVKERDAIAEAQRYINARVGPSGVAAVPAEEAE